MQRRRGDEQVGIADELPPLAQVAADARETTGDSSIDIQHAGAVQESTKLCSMFRGVAPEVDASNTSPKVTALIANPSGRSEFSSATASSRPFKYEATTSVSTRYTQSSTGGRPIDKSRDV